MHADYQRYPSVGAIVHAHPVTLSAFSCAETPIDIGLLSETYALLDPPVVAPYALMGTEELAEIVAECAGRSSAILLRNHAVVTTGANLMQAFSRLEYWKRRPGDADHPPARSPWAPPEQRAELDRFMGRDVRPAKRRLP